MPRHLDLDFIRLSMTSEQAKRRSSRRGVERDELGCVVSDGGARAGKPRDVHRLHVVAIRDWRVRVVVELFPIKGGPVLMRKP